MKKTLHNIVFILTALIYLSFSAEISHADTLLIRKGGEVELVKGEHLVDLSHLLFDRKTQKSVLGTSSTVTVTIDVSPFLPTDTPTPSPSNTPTPSPTPTPTTTPSSGSPTNTPTPTATPTPSPTQTQDDNLLATIVTNNGTTSEVVDNIVVESENDPIIISSNDGTVTISQGENEVTTDLPIQVDSQKNQLQAEESNNNFVPIITPDEAIESLKKHGTFLIPSTIKTYLVRENGSIIYRIRGLVNFQVFNLFVVKLPSTVVIDAVKGIVISVEDSLILKIFKFLRLGKEVIR